MKLYKLFLIQEQLDSEIVREHKLEGKDLLTKKILSLRVELGELANETRCFKFWSYKKPAASQNVLEEFVDCIHFILSIAKEVNFPIEKYDFKPYIQSEDDIVEQFNACYNIITMVEDRDFEEEYINYLIENLLGLGQLLGFSYEDIEKAYLDKNRINHERLVSGY